MNRPKNLLFVGLVTGDDASIDALLLDVPVGDSAIAGGMLTIEVLMLTASEDFCTDAGSAGNGTGIEDILFSFNGEVSFRFGGGGGGLLARASLRICAEVFSGLVEIDVEACGLKVTSGEVIDFVVLGVTFGVGKRL